jgi:2'-5' RNA ligase
MRLFIGLALGSRIKDAVYGVSLQIRPMYEGDFTKKENLHLTLKFLGEVQGSLLPTIRLGLHAAVTEQPAFSMTAARLGSFKGKNGDKTLWLGIDESAGLLNLFELLESALSVSGFAAETRPLREHITLARRAVFGDELFSKAAISPIIIPVNEVTLFESARVSGELIYKPLFAAKFKEHSR